MITYTKRPHMQMGRVEAGGVDMSDALYFAENCIALRLEGEHGVVVAALTRDALAKLNDLIKEEES